VKNPPEVFDTEVSLVQKQRGATIRPFAQPFSGLENPACGIAKGAYVFFAPPLPNPYRIPAKGAYVFHAPPSRFPAMREMGPFPLPYFRSRGNGPLYLSADKADDEKAGA